MDCWHEAAYRMGYIPKESVAKRPDLIPLSEKELASYLNRDWVGSSEASVIHLNKYCSLNMSKAICQKFATKKAEFDKDNVLSCIDVTDFRFQGYNLYELLDIVKNYENPKKAEVISVEEFHEKVYPILREWLTPLFPFPEGSNIKFKGIHGLITEIHQELVRRTL